MTLFYCIDVIKVDMTIDMVISVCVVAVKYYNIIVLLSPHDTEVVTTATMVEAETI